jgi:hypothetical protein
MKLKQIVILVIIVALSYSNMISRGKLKHKNKVDGLEIAKEYVHFAAVANCSLQKLQYPYTCMACLNLGYDSKIIKVAFHDVYWQTEIITFKMVTIIRADELVISFAGPKSTIDKHIGYIQHIYETNLITNNFLHNKIIHKEFWDIYVQFREILKGIVTSHSYSHMRFKLVGYSFGAVMAILAENDMRNNWYIMPTRIHVVTYSALQLTRDFTRFIVDKEHHIMITHKRDFITQVPKCIFVGSEFWCYNELTTLIRERPMFTNYFINIYPVYKETILTIVHQPPTSHHQVIHLFPQVKILKKNNDNHLNYAQHISPVDVQTNETTGEAIDSNKQSNGSLSHASPETQENEIEINTDEKAILPVTEDNNPANITTNEPEKQGEKLLTEDPDTTTRSNINDQELPKMIQTQHLANEESIGNPVISQNMIDESKHQVEVSQQETGKSKLSMVEESQQLAEEGNQQQIMLENQTERTLGILDDPSTQNVTQKLEENGKNKEAEGEKKEDKEEEEELEGDDTEDPENETIFDPTAPTDTEKLKRKKYKKKKDKKENRTKDDSNQPQPQEQASFLERALKLKIQSSNELNILNHYCKKQGDYFVCQKQEKIIYFGVSIEDCE